MQVRSRRRATERRREYRHVGGAIPRDQWRSRKKRRSRAERSERRAAARREGNLTERRVEPEESRRSGSGVGAMNPGGTARGERSRGDAGQLPTRKKPSKGERTRELRARSEAWATRRTTDVEPTRRTSDPEPAATRRRPRVEEAVEVVRDHEDGTSGRCGNRQPKPRRASRKGSFSEREWTPSERDGREEKPEKDASFERGAERWTSDGPDSPTGSGQTAGDDATGGGGERMLKGVRTRPGVRSTEWPSATTNHRVGSWEGQRPAHDRGRRATARPRARANVRGGKPERATPGSGTTPSLWKASAVHRLIL